MKRGRREGKYVSIDPIYLRLAMKASGVSIPSVASEIGITRQAFHRMQQGNELRTCLASTRAKIAKTLNVPEPVISGGFFGKAIRVLSVSVLYAVATTIAEKHEPNPAKRELLRRKIVEMLIVDSAQHAPKGVI